MKKLHCSSSISILCTMKLILTILLLFHLLAFSNSSSHVYIVHVRPNADVQTLPNSPPVLYHYQQVFSGFSARMTEHEASQLKGEDWFVSARKERSYSLLTTHSPSFLGLERESRLWERSSYGEGVIIGVLDTGIALDHVSFGDEGMPPPPSKWKGVCELNQTTSCNKKLIGAQFFEGDSVQLDVVGHGSHTSGIAAGNFVKGANVYGNAEGTTSGVAPMAHLAMYKVCRTSDCPESMILAGMDAAIADGVDIISMSVGGDPLPWYEDSVVIGAFRAMEKGILVTCAAGNSGPGYGTILNEATWVLTVGASTIDREIVVSAHLGNGQVLHGQSSFRSDISQTGVMPVVFARNSDAKYCIPGSLSDLNVRGKAVVCEGGGDVTRIVKATAVKDAGGAAMILMNTEEQAFVVLADLDDLPATNINYEDSLKLKAYLNSTSSPTVSLSFEGTRIGNINAPVVAPFSSRGPSLASPGILKPDIIGPGVSILAAWPFPVDNTTNSSASFNIVSGTSMACPHLSGVAALIKSLHPDWSPAAIKSAILTTADQLNRDGNAIEDQTLTPADIFALGAGHVNPSKASDPGLIYDINSEEYVSYLCGLNYMRHHVGKIVQREINCTAESKIPEQQLNYPTFSIKLVDSIPQTYTRTLMNVGEPGTYDLEIGLPVGVDVDVQPRTLTFSKLGEKHIYTVKFSVSTKKSVVSQVSAGYISWKSPKYSVRSAIAVQFGSYTAENGFERSEGICLSLMRYSLIAVGFIIAHR